MVNSFARVDYFSYTIKGDASNDGASHERYNILLQNAPKYLARWMDEADFTVPKRQNGYNMGFNIRQAIYVWSNGKDTHVEITGDGCTMLYETGELLGIIKNHAWDATRIDIAHDLETDETPMDFVLQTGSKKTTASGTQDSRDGHTCYVGSRKSDRYVKVYRYNKPHPRAHLLRIEYTYKRENAQTVAMHLIRSNEAIVAFSSGERYKWESAAYKTLQTPDLIEIKAHRKDRNTAKTVIWFKVQVLPALKKVIKSGDMSIDDIIADIRRLTDE